MAGSRPKTRPPRIRPAKRLVTAPPRLRTRVKSSSPQSNSKPRTRPEGEPGATLDRVGRRDRGAGAVPRAASEGARHIAAAHVAARSVPVQQLRLVLVGVPVGLPRVVEGEAEAGGGIGPGARTGPECRSPRRHRRGARPPRGRGGRAGPWAGSPRRARRRSRRRARAPGPVPTRPGQRTNDRRGSGRRSGVVKSANPASAQRRSCR